MDLRVTVTLGGDTVGEGETGAVELVRVLLEGVTAVALGHVAEVGDSVVLRDFNGDEIGSVALVPSEWAPGDEVWFKDRRWEIEHAEPAYLAGYQDVVLREIRTAVVDRARLVDPAGQQPDGRSIITRVRS